MDDFGDMPLPSLTDLSRGKGVISRELSGLPPWMLTEADRWAAETADYQKKHLDPKRLPFPDPWQFLLDAPVVSADAKRVFQAARSQLYGYRQLARKATGVATYNTDWHMEAADAKAAGDEERFAYCLRRVSDALLKYEQVRADMEKVARCDPEFRKQMEAAYKERRRRLAHHNRVDEIDQAKPLPGAGNIRTEQQLAAMLVEWWVRCGECLPGLMCFGSKALWVFLSALSTKARYSTLDSIKRLRQRLDLTPVSEENPFVWSVSIRPLNGGDWHILGQQRDGKEAFSFCGQAVFNKQPIPPTQSVPQSCS